MRQSNTDQFNKKAAIFISVFLAVIFSLSAIYIIAEFTKSSRAKRVIATSEGYGMLFSSNYLSPNSNAMYIQSANSASNVSRRMIYATSSETSAADNITVCNYAQGNLTKMNENTIEYELCAKLVGIDASGNIFDITNNNKADYINNGETVTLTFKNGDPVVLSASRLNNKQNDAFPTSILTGGVSVTDLCHVEFSPNFNEHNSNLALYICAHPNSSSVGVTDLDAVFTTGINSINNKWTGEFNEDTQSTGEGNKPKQPNYDGFNYLISGSGKGQITLEWDNTKVQINQVFIKSIQDEVSALITAGLLDSQASVTYNAGNNGTSTLIFPVDSNNTDRYDLQFYYADGFTPDNSWAWTGGLISCVECTYEEED